MGENATQAPLAGLRVVELARILAGPWAGQVLADLGAEVIKVEAPEGDDTRRWGPPWIEVEGDRLAGELKSLEGEVARMENLTRRLSDDYLDLDLLDQQARDVLGVMRSDEIVVR